LAITPFVKKTFQQISANVEIDFFGFVLHSNRRITASERKDYAFQASFFTGVIVFRCHSFPASFFSGVIYFGVILFRRHSFLASFFSGVILFRCHFWGVIFPASFFSGVIFSKENNNILCQLHVCMY
jgi:hypothetical protein